MTFDDGIVKIYGVEDIAKPGNKPKEALCFKASFCFSYAALGIQRHYAALKANELIESVICTYEDRGVRIYDVAVMEDGSQFRIVMVQPEIDENGIKIQKLSLERLNNEYQYQTEENT